MDLTLLDLFFILLPVLIFAIHVKHGKDLRFFGNDDGLSAGLLCVIPIYIVGVILIFSISRQVGYTLLVVSCIIRPLVWKILEQPGAHYNKKHPRGFIGNFRMNHALHDPEELEKGSKKWRR